MFLFCGEKNDKNVTLKAYSCMHFILILFCSTIFCFLWGDLGKRVWSHCCCKPAPLPRADIRMASFILFLLLISTVT